MTIEIDPRWSLADPTDQLPLTEKGAFAFGGKVGDLYLPNDYLAFLKRYDGGALRRGRSWFVAQFQDGGRKMQIDWLGNAISIRNGTQASFAPDGSGQNFLPPGFVRIGLDELNGADILIKANPSASDHGHVFTWFYTEDEWMSGENTHGLGFIAPSFTAFMNGLRDENEL